MQINLRGKAGPGEREREKGELSDIRMERSPRRRPRSRGLVVAAFPAPLPSLAPKLGLKAFPEYQNEQKKKKKEWESVNDEKKKCVYAFVCEREGGGGAPEHHQSDYARRK